MRISKNSPVSEATSMDMLNCTIYIFINVTGIKFQLSINKMLHNICNKTGLQTHNKNKIFRGWKRSENRHFANSQSRNMTVHYTSRNMCQLQRRKRKTTRCHHLSCFYSCFLFLKGRETKFLIYIQKPCILSMNL